MIPSKTLKFWEFEDHPFADNILKGDLQNLFVGREEQVEDVEDSLGHSRVVGIYGSLGVGKSSFLHKISHSLEAEGYPVALVQLNADSETTLYREILAEMLCLWHSDNLKLENPKCDLESEIQRLYSSVNKSRGANFGGKLLGLLGGDFTENKTVETTSHDEASARATIGEMFDSLNTPLIIVLDDFEKLKYESSGVIRDYFPILSRFVSTLEESLNHKLVSFVVSMDDHVEELIIRNQKEGGAFAFSLNSLIRLPNLSLNQLLEMICIRLHQSGWEEGIGEFVTEDAFYGLALSSSNHPRVIVRILAEAMKLAAREKTAPITLTHIATAAKKLNYSVVEKEFKVVEYLRENRTTSGSDLDLLKLLGYKTPKKSGDRNRAMVSLLNKLVKKLDLEETEVSVGATKKKILSLPAIDFLE